MNIFRLDYGGNEHDWIAARSEDEAVGYFEDTHGEGPHGVCMLTDEQIDATQVMEMDEDEAPTNMFISMRELIGAELADLDAYLICSSEF